MEGDFSVEKICENLDLKERLSEDFAVRIINLEKFLREERKERRISDQIFRSGTSIAANIAESKYAESDSDFIHKLAIAQKETNETLYWLRLLCRTNYIDRELYTSLTSDCITILSILTKIIVKTKSKSKSKSKK